LRAFSAAAFLANSLAVNFGTALTDLTAGLAVLPRGFAIGLALPFLTGAIVGLARTLLTVFAVGLTAFLAIGFAGLAFTEGLVFLTGALVVFTGVFALLTGFVDFLWAGTLETSFFIVIFAMVSLIS
jgi:hypothetical protein